MSEKSTKQKIANKLVLMVDYEKKSRILMAEPDFFLVGTLGAKIVWADGKEEVVMLAGRVRIQRFPDIRKLLGKAHELKMIRKMVREKWSEELIDRMTDGFKQIDRKKKLYGKHLKIIKIL